MLGMWKWKCKIFNLSHNYETNNYVKIWMGPKFGSCRYCERRDIKFLICHMNTPDHAMRVSCAFMNDFPSS